MWWTQQQQQQRSGHLIGLDRAGAKNDRNHTKPDIPDRDYIFFQKLYLCIRLFRILSFSMNNKNTPKDLVPVDTTIEWMKSWTSINTSPRFCSPGRSYNAFSRMYFTTTCTLLPTNSCYWYVVAMLGARVVWWIRHTFTKSKIVFLNLTRCALVLFFPSWKGYVSTKLSTTRWRGARVFNSSLQYTSNDRQ